ncbi:hypothetical protein B0A48_03210 [Cryoendolithus antarcticus]|uniref:Uncharacterized protein n=1 Tax=Cryoendolithus antarcticus TaxID=1507870 RepID=A0A1V8TJC3_9PEZI|nr:hypothetical protein B0A48_03210 [Cryoendolithus antarcticus]
MAPPPRQTCNPNSAWALGLKPGQKAPKRKAEDVPTTAAPPTKKAKPAPVKAVKPKRVPPPVGYKSTMRPSASRLADPRPVAAPMQQQRAAPSPKRAREEETGDDRQMKKARVMEPPMAQKPSSGQPAVKAPMYAPRDLPKSMFKKRTIEQVNEVSSSRPLDPDYKLPETRAEAKKAPKKVVMKKVVPNPALFSDDEEDFIVPDDVIEYRDDAPKKRRKLSASSATSFASSAALTKKQVKPKAKTPATLPPLKTVEPKAKKTSADTTSAVTIAESKAKETSASSSITTVDTGAITPTATTLTIEPEVTMPAANNTTSPPPVSSSPAAIESTEDSQDTIDVSRSSISGIDVSISSAPTSTTPTSSPPPAPTAAKKQIAGERIGTDGYGIGTKGRLVRQPGQKGVAQKVRKNSRAKSPTDSESSVPKKKKRTTKRRDSASEGEESERA